MQGDLVDPAVEQQVVGRKEAAGQTIQRAAACWKVATEESENHHDRQVYAPYLRKLFQLVPSARLPRRTIDD